MTVSGWALDDPAVAGVRVFVDGRFEARTGISILRSDLIKVYPQYLHGTDRHGWKIDVAVPAQPGARTVLARAVDDGGATHDLTTVSITVR